HFRLETPHHGQPPRKVAVEVQALPRPHPLLSIERQWHPEVRRKRGIHSKKFSRRHAHQLHGRPVDRYLLPDRASIGAQLIRPEFIRNDRYWSRGRIVIERSQLTAQDRRHSQSVKKI